MAPPTGFGLLGRALLQEPVGSAILLASSAVAEDRMAPPTGFSLLGRALLQGPVSSAIFVILHF